MALITGKTVLGYKIPEILDLDQRGLVMKYTYPLNLEKEEDVLILNSMMDAAERAGSPYLLTRIEHGYSKDRVVLWKEKKSIRCKKCGNFLNARPPKFKPTLTHRQIGTKCAASG